MLPSLRELATGRRWRESNTLGVWRQEMSFGTSMEKMIWVTLTESSCLWEKRRLCKGP